MKKIFFLCFVVLVILSLSITACGKKTTEQTPPSQSVEQNIPAAEAKTVYEAQPAPDQTIEANAVQATAETTETGPAESVEGLTVEQIQQALKNAGLYTGEIDGKSGPLTQKAIEDFQAQNGLKADGKVGRYTWGKLKPYLQQEPNPVTQE